MCVEGLRCVRVGGAKGEPRRWEEGIDKGRKNDMDRYWLTYWIADSDAVDICAVAELLCLVSSPIFLPTATTADQ